MHVSFAQASMTDCPDIEFNYDDADLPENEIAELYSYTEGPEFQLNLKVKTVGPLPYFLLSCRSLKGVHAFCKVCVLFCCSYGLSCWYGYVSGCSTLASYVQAWEEVCGELGVVPLWQSASDASHRALIIRLADHLELSNRTPRMRAARAILYIAQVRLQHQTAKRKKNVNVRL